MRIKDTDAARSHAEIEQRLNLVAGNPREWALARAVSRRYLDALLSYGDARDERWRTFILALDAFLTHATPTPSSHLNVLRSIVAENADLKEQQPCRLTA